MTDALLPIMAVASMPSGSMTLSSRLQTAAPRMFRHAIGGVLELMIHAVETWRDRRIAAAR